MMARSYSTDPTQDAIVIAAECMRTGKSTGWSGTIEHRDAVAALLLRSGVRYTDDMRGEWTAGADLVQIIRDRAREHCGREGDGEPTCSACCAMFQRAGIPLT